ncbi:MAG TPA: histidine phosphatase family protein [Hyphomicrobium sp.]|jgi:alpha-ribazole phosphatase
MMRIDLLRHGETATPGRLLGRTDPVLSDTGWQQLGRQTTDRRWDTIVASPRQRTRAPAEQLAAERALPLRVDDDWAEMDFGDWDGREISALRADATCADALAALYGGADAAQAPAGETWHALNARIARALARLLDVPSPTSVLVITHAGPMRAALALVCGIPPASLWAVKIDPGTRITLHAGRDPGTGLWGEIVEVAQP